MSDNYRAKLKSVFDQADTSGDGLLSIQEVTKVLKSCGCTMDQEKINQCFLEDDTNDDFKISFEEFWNANNKRDPKDVKVEELRSVFNDLDKDGSGVLTAEDMKICIGQISDEDAAAMLADMDLDSDGKIKFEEFLEAWRAKL